MKPENANIPDLWTKSSYYADLYQNDEQIHEVIQLLDIHSANSLIDIGCGNGVFAIAAASQFPNCSVMAIDSLSSAIEETRKRACAANCARFRAEVASADSLPMPDLSVDRILFRNVLHHVTSINKAFAEISRVLQPSGLLVLETPCNPGDDTLGALISDIHILMDGSHHRTYHKPKDISASMESHGIAASTPQCWPYRFPVNTEQIELIRSRGAQRLLSLDKTGEGGPTIQLVLTRIIGRKKES